MRVNTEIKRFWFQNLTVTFSADIFSVSSSLSTKGKQTLKDEAMSKERFGKTALQLVKRTLPKPTLIQTTDLINSSRIYNNREFSPSGGM